MGRRARALLSRAWRAIAKRGEHLGPDSVVAWRRGVMMAQQADHVLVVDPKLSGYFALDDTGAFVWNLLNESRTIAKISEVTACEFGASQDVVLSDLVHFIDELRTRGLVSVDPIPESANARSEQNVIDVGIANNESSIPVPSERLRTVGAFRAFLMLGTVRLLLVNVGLKRTQIILDWLSQNAQLSAAEAGCSSQQIVRDLACAGVFLPLRAECLEHSLALNFFTRRRGLATSVKLGVQALPFLAHAWVELNGFPINENIDRVRTFAPLSSVPTLRSVAFNAAQ